MRTKYLIISKQVVGSCEKKQYLILRLGLVGLEEITFDSSMLLIRKI